MSDDPGGEWRRPGPTRTQRRHDLWLAAAVAAGGVLSTVLFNSTGTLASGVAPSLAEQLAWMTAMALPLAVRRRFPATVVLLVAGVFLAAQARHIGDNLVPSIILFMAIFSLGAWGRHRVAARWLRVGVVAVMFAWVGISLYSALAGPPLEFPHAAGPLDPVLATVLLGIGVNVLFFVTAYYFGNLAWESAQRQHELQVRGDELRRSQAENGPAGGGGGAATDHPRPARRGGPPRVGDGGAGGGRPQGPRRRPGVPRRHVTVSRRGDGPDRDRRAAWTARRAPVWRVDGAGPDRSPGPRAGAGGRAGRAGPRHRAAGRPGRVRGPAAGAGRGGPVRLPGGAGGAHQHRQARGSLHGGCPDPVPRPGTGGGGQRRRPRSRAGDRRRRARAGGHAGTGGRARRRADVGPRPGGGFQVRARFPTAPAASPVVAR